MSKCPPAMPSRWIFCWPKLGKVVTEVDGKEWDQWQDHGVGDRQRKTIRCKGSAMKNR